MEAHLLQTSGATNPYIGTGSSSLVIHIPMLIAFLSIQLWFCLKGEKKKRTMVAPDTGFEFELKVCIEWVFLCICIAGFFPYSFLPLFIRFHLKKFSNTLNKNFSFWGQIEVMQVFHGKFISLFSNINVWNWSKL